MSTDSRVRLAVALRVLNAFTSYIQPSEEDVAALREFIPESQQSRPLDELARELIQGEVEAASAENFPQSAASGQ
jgi:hypothetical protein